VDLDGAKAGAIQNHRVLEEIAAATKLQIDFGGGVKKEQDIKDVMNAGAAMVTIGSLAVKHPDLLAQWIAGYGTKNFSLVQMYMRKKLRSAVGCRMVELAFMISWKTCWPSALHNFFAQISKRMGRCRVPQLTCIKRL
jgi:phosphoribosylformimino-5-aminoimidazole carboxamide ribonucleotide (ProFAR) isomerase